MGNQDNWHTPKQIKIEREKPRPQQRGILKKGERRKGKKARVDELLSGVRSLKMYAEWILRDRETKRTHPEWYQGEYAWTKWHEKYFDQHAQKQEVLIANAIADGVITTDGNEYRVTKP